MKKLRSQLRAGTSKRLTVKNSQTNERKECSSVDEVKDFIGDCDIKSFQIESNLTWNTIDAVRFLAAGSQAFRIYSL